MPKMEQRYYFHPRHAALARHFDVAIEAKRFDILRIETKYVRMLQKERGARCEAARDTARPLSRRRAAFCCNTPIGCFARLFAAIAPLIGLCSICIGLNLLASIVLLIERAARKRTI